MSPSNAPSAHVLVARDGDVALHVEGSDLAEGEVGIVVGADRVVLRQQDRDLVLAGLGEEGRKALASAATVTLIEAFRGGRGGIKVRRVAPGLGD